jgi:repressor LexA
MDGDIVFIREQSMVDNGEIAAVVIEDEATLKRVYYDGTTFTLIAENPKYQPMVFSGETLNHVRILGKAIAFQSDVI